ETAKTFLVNITNNAPTVAGLAVKIGATTLPAPITLSHNPGDFDLYFTNTDNLSYSATWSSLPQVAYSLNQALSFKLTGTGTFSSTPAKKLLSNINGQ